MFSVFLAVKIRYFRTPACAVLVTGCYAQLSRGDLLAMDERICVLVGQRKDALAAVPALLRAESGLTGSALAQFLQATFDAPAAAPVPRFTLTTDTFLHHSRASLKIQDGCNAVCTYCRIRLARGPSVSLAVQDVLDRVAALERAGQAEVVITTVNIAQYGGGWQDGFADFAALLALMLAHTHTIGIRISSLYPEIVTDRLADIIAHPRVRPHFHLSIQSGSDAVLAKMKRPYRAAAVVAAAERLRRAKGNPFLACEIIAGFPGETDEDFAQTMTLLHETEMTFVHAFPFSARPGTEASAMRPMVSQSVARARVAQLDDYSHRAKSAYISSFAGAELPAVCETVRRAPFAKDTVIVHAVTDNFLHCQLRFPAGSPRVPRPGSLVRVVVRRPLAEHERTGESDTLADCVPDTF